MGETGPRALAQAAVRMQQLLVQALRLPRTAEVTDLHIRPMRKGQA